MFKDGVSIDPSKVEVVVDWVHPKSVTNIKNFLGLVRYYHIFVKGFLNIATPLIRFTKKNVKFEWDNECEKSFIELRHRLTTTPILTIPFGTRGYAVYSYACHQGLGYVLMQHGKVIACRFRQLKVH